MELPSIINTGISILSFSAVVIVTPLLRYIVATKDKQIDELRKIVDKNVTDREVTNEKLHCLELSVTRFSSEIEMARQVNVRLERMTEQLDELGKQMSGMQVTVNHLVRGRIVSVPTTRSDFPNEKSGG